MRRQNEYRKIPVMSPGLIQFRKQFEWACIGGGLIFGGLISGIKKTFRNKLREARKAPESTWVLGDGIELPCVCYLFGNKEHKAQVRKQIRQEQRSLYGEGFDRLCS